MAYDEGLADRTRRALRAQHGTVDEKKMFGGLCFLVRGNMVCGVMRDELMVRVGPDAHAAALARPHAREMDFTGRSLKGMVYVSADGVDAQADLDQWVADGLAFAGKLPPKEPKPKKPRARKA